MVGGVSGISAAMVHMLSLTGLGVGSVRAADTCLRGVVQGSSVLSGAPELIVDVESCGGGGVIVKWFSSRCITVSLSIVVVVGVWEVGIHAASVHTSDSIVLLALSWDPVTAVAALIGGGMSLSMLWCAGIKSVTASSL